MKGQCTRGGAVPANPTPLSPPSRLSGVPSKPPPTCSKCPSPCPCPITEFEASCSHAAAACEPAMPLSRVFRDGLHTSMDGVVRGQTLRTGVPINRLCRPVRTVGRIKMLRGHWSWTAKSHCSYYACRFEYKTALSRQFSSVLLSSFPFFPSYVPPSLVLRHLPPHSSLTNTIRAVVLELVWHHDGA